MSEDLVDLLGFLILITHHMGVRPPYDTVVHRERRREKRAYRTDVYITKTVAVCSP